MACPRSGARLVAIVVLSACPSNTVHVRKNPGSLPCNDTYYYGCCIKNDPAYDANDRVGSSNREPLVVFSSGCAGSTAVVHMIKELAEVAHDSIYNCGCSFELTRDIANGKYGGETEAMTDKVRSFVKLANDTHRRLLFKHELVLAQMDPLLMKYLETVGARFVNFWRSNKLDVALCEVHDCFLHATPKPIGYEVDRDGIEVKHCEFRGRGPAEATETRKVFINTDNLVENLRSLMRVEEETIEFLTDMGASFSSATYENLFRFNSEGDAGLTTSAIAWKELMSTFGVELDENSIRAILKVNQDEHHAPQPHATLISNYDAVNATLASCTGDYCEEMKSWLRESVRFP